VSLKSGLTLDVCSIGKEGYLYLALITDKHSRKI